MKYGVCLSLKQHDRIEIAANYGYDYIEIGFAEMTQASEEDYRAFLATLARVGIPCEAANGFLPGTLKVTGEDIDPAALTAYLEKGMARAKEIGIQVVVFGSAGARNLADGYPYRKGLEQMIEFLRTLAGPIAAKYGVSIAIEPLQPGESNIVNRVREGVVLAAASGCPNVGGLGDLYHMAIIQDDPSELSILKGAIFHTHISNPALNTPNPRRYPSTPTEYDYHTFLTAASAADCPRCSVEAGCSDFTAEAPRALETMKASV